MSVSVKDLDDLLEKLSDARTRKEAKEEELKVINKEYNQYLFKTEAHLKELGRNDYASDIGKVKIKEEWKVRLPETDLDKREFFDHLRSRGIFDKFATVNSNSLNALYRADWVEAQGRGEGMTFNMPGIKAPVIERVPKFKPAKSK